MLAHSFINQEKYKIIATLMVAAFFLYFWINGPLQQSEAILTLEHEETEFARPILVNESQQNKEHFGTVGNFETKGYGNGLVLENEETKKNSNLIENSNEDQVNSMEFTNKLIDHAQKIIGGKGVLKANSDMYYVLVNKEDEQYIYTESTGIINDIRGYAGSVNIALVVDDEGAIISLHHVSSKETESYLKKIANEGFYNQFIGLKLHGANRVDAVSGATLTTEAIAKTATKLVEKAMPEPLVTFADVSELKAFEVEAKLTWWWILHISVIFILFVYGIQKKFKKSKQGIIVISIISVVYIGFFLNNSFTFISFLHPFVGTQVSSLVGLYALFTLLGAIWGKNTYCKYVCPFGNAQRLVLQFSPKKMRSKFFIPNQYINKIRLGITMVLMTGVLLGLRSWSNFELFPDLFGLDIKTVWFFIAVITVFFTARYPMIWCRLLCPTGSVLDLITDAVNYKAKSKKQKVNKLA